MICSTKQADQALGRSLRSIALSCRQAYMPTTVHVSMHAVYVNCIPLSTLVLDREVLLRLCVLRGAEMITPKHGRLDSVTAMLICGALGLWISLGRWAGYTLSKHHWRSKRFPPVTSRALLLSRLPIE